MEHSPTRETPFRLTYGIDAMIPVEVRHLSPRAANQTTPDELTLNLDLLPEEREKAAIHLAEYKRRMAAAHQ